MAIGNKQTMMKFCHAVLKLSEWTDTTDRQTDNPKYSSQNTLHYFISNHTVTTADYSGNEAWITSITLYDLSCSPLGWVQSIVNVMIMTVCLSTRISQKPQTELHRIFLHAVSGRGSVVL